MIRFEQKEQKTWQILYDKTAVVNLNLVSSSVTNKFSIITTFVENISKVFGKDFDQWFLQFFVDYYKNEERKFSLVIENAPKLKSFVDEYISSRGIDFSQFVDESKAKKSSILFSAVEIEKIIRLSGYLKLYAIFSNSEGLKLDQKLHRKVYNELATEVIDSDVVFKIFNVIKTKTFRYNLTDRYMWDYIKMIQCKSIDVHVIEIFNFIMNSILILCEEDRNPITYFIGVIDESVKWFLRSVYKGSIIYDDSVSTEDIHGLNVNNLKTYAYNDTLGRLKGVAYERIYEILEEASSITFGGDGSDQTITEFQNRVSNVKYISPLCECLVFPVLSKLANIPYNHFKTLSPEHAIVLSVYAQHLLTEVFVGEYRNMFSLLNFYPSDTPSPVTTYKLKAVHDHINKQNELKDFFGFDEKIVPYDILSYFVGRISRINFYNVWDGKRLVGIPLSKIELDMISFYTLFFAGRFEKEMEQMKKIMSTDF